MIILYVQLLLVPGMRGSQAFFWSWASLRAGFELDLHAPRLSFHVRLRTRRVVFNALLRSRYQRATRQN